MALADEYEVKLLNGILGVQQPGVIGSLSYMTPLGHGVNRNKWDWYGFGNDNNSFWCCYGTAIESFAKLGDSIYFNATTEEEGPSLLVTQFIPSSLQWAEIGLQLHLAAELRLSANGLPPDSPRLTAGLSVNLTLTNITAASLAIRIRIPGWASDGSSIRTRRGKATPASPGTFQSAPLPPGGWKPGDVVTLWLAMAPRLKRIIDDRPEYESVSAILLGPLVLAGITNESNLLLADPGHVADWVVPRAVPCPPPAHAGAAPIHPPSATGIAALSAPWGIWSPTAADCIELVAYGSNHEYRLLPLARVALDNYTVYYNITKP